MNSERVGDLMIMVAAPNSGKSHDMREQLGTNARNIIIPANRSDAFKTWGGIPELKWEPRMVPDTFNPNRMVPSIHFPELHTFKGNRLLNADGDARFLEALADPKTGYMNGGLFIDDFRRVIGSNGNLSKRVGAMFGNRRHHMLDIYMACHSVQDISGDIFKTDVTLVIGRTTMAPSAAVEEKMHPEHFRRLVEVMERVNRINAEQPELLGRYKEQLEIRA